MATKLNVLCFNEYISDHLKMKMTKGEKHHAPLSLPFSVHPQKKIGNLRGRGVGRSFARTRSYVTFAV
nr:MAG TPA: hypothetical protein [Caudoviricetes sp.]